MGAFGGSTYSSGPRSTYSFRENELVDKILLCCRLACHLVKVGVWAMAEVSQWNIFLNHPLMRRKVLTMMRCSFGRDSTWRSTAYPARSCCCMGYVGVLSPTKAESRILGVPSPFVVSVSVQSIPSRVTDTSNKHIPAKSAA